MPSSSPGNPKPEARAPSPLESSEPRRLKPEAPSSDLDAWHMQRAIELAWLGQGAVEPNPMVGCVIAHGAEIIGQGYHRRFGGPHAEVEALALAGARSHGATVYVTLEPCCHHGKTPPCSQALIAAGVARVVVAMRDPFPAVAGGGLAELHAARIDVTVGVCEFAARELNAPYLKLLAKGRPWVIAKWAMTLDGKLASHTGSSRWISGEASRAVAHRLRGRVDAVIVGRGTVEADDPLLTARPAGPRTATRIVLDRRASILDDSQLVRTAGDSPVLIACSRQAGNTDVQNDAANREVFDENCQRLRASGCEVLLLVGANEAEQWAALLDELGRRRMTNLLVEGGGRVLGSCFDAGLIDELYVFIAPKLIGGDGARSPLAGLGIDDMAAAQALERVTVERLQDDIYVHGFVRRDGS